MPTGLRGQAHSKVLFILSKQSSSQSSDVPLQKALDPVMNLHIKAPRATRTHDDRHPSDLELAALISSKVCHDIIGPVGAIYNGLEILAEDKSAETQSYALDVIRNVTEQASARLQFARFAFGASGSAGSQIELGQARSIAENFVSTIKHRLIWAGPSGMMAKDRVKLLLNLVACSVSALPRGGDIQVHVSGSLDAPAFDLTCKGRGARPPNFLRDLINGTGFDEIDPMSVQAYYTWRLANTVGLKLSVNVISSDEVVLRAA